MDRNDPYRKAMEAPRASDGAGLARPRRGMARVVRDENGKVVDIIEYEEEVETTPWGAALNEDEDDSAPPPTDVAMMPPRLNEDGIVGQTLTEMAEQITPVERYTSAGENAWLVELVRAHGDDVQAMARDLKRNLWQKTPGEIRRALRKAGGCQAVAAMQ